MPVRLPDSSTRGASGDGWIRTADLADMSRALLPPELHLYTIIPSTRAANPIRTILPPPVSRSDSRPVQALRSSGFRRSAEVSEFINDRALVAMDSHHGMDRDTGAARS